MKYGIQCAGKSGCDYDPYRLGQHECCGLQKTAPTTTKKFSVVTQFITQDVTPKGDLSEIRRLYAQEGKVIKNIKSNVPAGSS